YGRAIIGGALQASNWFTLFESVVHSYTGLTSDLYAVSIVAQFCLLWPLLLVFLLRRCTPGSLIAVIVGLVVGLNIERFALAGSGRWAWAFLGTDVAAATLLAGALLALLLEHRNRTSSVLARHQWIPYGALLALCALPLQPRQTVVSWALVVTHPVVAILTAVL